MSRPPVSNFVEEFNNTACDMCKPNRCIRPINYRSPLFCIHPSRDFENGFLTPEKSCEIFEKSCEIVEKSCPTVEHDWILTLLFGIFVLTFMIFTGIMFWHVRACRKDALYIAGKIGTRRMINRPEPIPVPGRFVDVPL
uniref:Uncharacterized protein n=1 Tax=Panagrolaimus sp. PS1159 TaxID=55785 RepID=A0AC35FK77_9BILA